MKKEEHQKMMKKRFDLKNKNNTKRINNVIKKEVNKRDLWRTKESIKNKKLNEYCKENNSHNTNGGWKNKRYCSTKSQWQRELENKEPEKVKKIKVKMITREAVILYEKETGKADVYEADVEKMDGEIIVKIINGRKKIGVKVHEEIIDNEELLELALKYRASIYVIDEIIEK